VEHRAAVREPDAERRDGEQRAQHHERQPRERDVHQALGHGDAPLQGVSWAACGSDRRRARDACRVAPLSRSTTASRALNVPAAHTNMTEAKSKRFHTYARGVGGGSMPKRALRIRCQTRTNGYTN